MRLFHRSLLCLVVGVTAFGAAGWGLRPKASWSVELEDAGDHPHFVWPAGEAPAADTPVWVFLDEHNDLAIGGGAATFEARDPKTGAGRAKVNAPLDRSDLPMV